MSIDNLVTLSNAGQSDHPSASVLFPFTFFCFHLLLLSFLHPSCQTSADPSQITCTTPSGIKSKKYCCHVTDKLKQAFWLAPQNPVVNFDLPIRLDGWFPRQRVRQKREDIRRLILELHRKQNDGQWRPCRPKAATGGHRPGHLCNKSLIFLPCCLIVRDVCSFFLLLICFVMVQILRSQCKITKNNLIYFPVEQFPGSFSSQTDMESHLYLCLFVFYFLRIPTVDANKCSWRCVALILCFILQNRRPVIETRTHPVIGLNRIRCLQYCQWPLVAAESCTLGL